MGKPTEGKTSNPTKPNGRNNSKEIEVETGEK
jgi:hypothetical protein